MLTERKKDWAASRIEGVAHGRVLSKGGAVVRRRETAILLDVVDAPRCVGLVTEARCVEDSFKCCTVSALPFTHTSASLFSCPRAAGRPPHVFVPRSVYTPNFRPRLRDNREVTLVVEEKLSPTAFSCRSTHECSQQVQQDHWGKSLDRL